MDKINRIRVGEVGYEVEDLETKSTLQEEIIRVDELEIKLDKARFDIISNDILSGSSFSSYIINDKYYDTSGNIYSGSESKNYRILPLLKKIEDYILIDNSLWKAPNRYIHARCYDNSLNFIGSSTTQGTGTDGIIRLNLVENTKYFGLYWQIEEGNESSYERRSLINYYYNTIFTSLIKLDTTSLGIQNNDLLKGDIIYTDGYLNSNNTILPSEKYSTSDFIQVLTKTVYGSNLRKLGWYNINHELIEYVDQVELVNNAVYEKPENAIFVRITKYVNKTKIPKLLTTAIDSEDNVYLIQDTEIKHVLGSEDSVNSGINKEAINLFNPNDPEVCIGYYLVQGTDFHETPNYNVSGFIPVQEGVEYFTASNAAVGCRFVNFYDKDKQYISYIGDGTTVGIRQFSIPENCSYIRTVFYASDYNRAQISKYFTTYCDYSKKGLCISAPSIENPDSVITRKNINNPLFNKKWAICGDSFTDGYGNTAPEDWYIEEGMYAGKSKVYGYLIANRNNMRLQWLAAGGRTIATPQDNSFTNAFSYEGYYDSIDPDVDYITLYFGINDSHHAPKSTGDDGEDKTGEIPLGTIDDTTRDTFYGAWNVVIPYLLEHHPFAHIGIIVSNGCDTPEYRQAEIEIAKKYGIPYIDLNGDEKTPFMIRSQNIDIPKNIRDLRTKQQSIDYDGSVTGSTNRHPNKDAHEYQSTFIEEFLRRL